MSQNQQYVVIKGTKDGLTLNIDDQCSFDEIIEELDEKLSSKYQHLFDGPLISVKIYIGHRYITDEQKKQLMDSVQKKQNLVVKEIISDVITKEEADRLYKYKQTVSVTKIIRSGQVLQIEGDLLLIGDVNPGGMVVASGNIYILGALKGIAHAGVNGNHKAMIIASKMEPTQLRISKVISRAPDHGSEGHHEAECAYIDQDINQIVIDRVHQLAKVHLGVNPVSM